MYILARDQMSFQSNQININIIHTPTCVVFTCVAYYTVFTLRGGELKGVYVFEVYCTGYSDASTLCLLNYERWRVSIGTFSVYLSIVSEVRYNFIKTKHGCARKFEGNYRIL